MNQQEIFQNIKLKVSDDHENFRYFPSVVLITPNSKKKHFVVNQSPSQTVEECVAFAQKICDSYNETVGKGINPESVEKIYSKALNLVHQISDNVITSSNSPFVYMVDIRKELMELKEALTAAKLT